MSTVRVREAADGDAPAMARLLGELGYPTGAGDVPRRLADIRAQGRRFSTAIPPDGERRAR
ncbi:MAG: hypothetical protein HOQ11_18160 [Gemmatimonadaceae bacterium]|nr:hypothetical protein [Gemmatimonadaceae bacterium]NUQ93169.1 hypothetical protein [Gemmatimonadaceae bacterium]NUR19018.1 hypothetical protein [Gemmatimonadaceae bacterium]NUS99331.1 hypothetical protein [Gemmatimonadaceae bacterium]